MVIALGQEIDARSVSWAKSTRFVLGRIALQGHQLLHLLRLYILACGNCQTPSSQRGALWAVSVFSVYRTVRIPSACSGDPCVRENSKAIFRGLCRPCHLPQAYS